jgi:hypothetical protein
MKLQVPIAARLGEGLLFLLLAVVLLQKVSDFDVWYHLAIGREIVRALEIPVFEFLVYPNADQKGAFHEWGFGVALYAVHQIGGMWGLSLTNALIAAATLWLLFRAGHRRSWSSPAHILVLLAVYWWMHFRLAYRPEMLLYLALACEILLLERFLLDPGKRWLAPIPVLSFLLVQAHPSVIFLVAVLGAYAVQVAWNFRNRGDSLLRYGAWFALSAAVVLGGATINPYGFAQLTLPLSFVTKGEILRDIVEFMPTFDTAYKWPYLLLAASAVLAVAIQPRKRVVDWILLLVFGYLAYRYVRNVALFALVMYVPMARAGALLVRTCQARLARSRLRPGSWLNRKRMRGALWGAALAAGAYTFAVGIMNPDWGAGPRPGRFPETSARLINELRPPGRILNFYDMGGYLSWSLKGDYRVFIDGRHYETNRALRLHDSVLRADPGWRDVLDRYRINTIVTPATLLFSGMLVPLVAVLAGDDGWQLVATEERALLFLRRGASQNLPATYRMPKQEIWHQVIKEAQATAKKHPGQPKTYLGRRRDRSAALGSGREIAELDLSGER